jgi:spermidine synthase
MKPWILIETAAIPGGGELTLWQHGRDYVIRVGRDELMSSRAHGSEEALASRAYERLGQRAEPAVLIGGLGMGFTTAAALRGLPARGTITVAELIPAVVAWNRGPLAGLAGNPLADPRVAIHQGDVAGLLRAHERAYDVILLDVDNGPHALTSAGNQWLYGQAGLQRAHRALRPGGVLAVWSATPHEPFTRRLIQAGFTAEAVRVPAHGSKGAKHVIWLAVRRT